MLMPRRLLQLMVASALVSGVLFWQAWYHSGPIVTNDLCASSLGWSLEQCAAGLASHINKSDQWRLQPSLPYTVKLPDFLAGDAPRPVLISHEPGLTWGIYLNHVNKRLQNGEPAPTLPFHWLEWANLLAIHEYIQQPWEKKPTCLDMATGLLKLRFDVMMQKNAKSDLNRDVFGANIGSKVPYKSFCKHLSQADPEQSSISPGFDIFYWDARKESIELKEMYSKAHLVLSTAPIPRQLVVVFLDTGLVLVPFETSKVPPILTEKQWVADYMSSVQLDSVDAFKEVEEMAKLVPSSDQLDWVVSADASKPAELKLDMSLFDATLDIWGTTPECPASPPKHFRETRLVQDGGNHLDWRFFSSYAKNEELRMATIHHMTRAWLTFTRSHGLVLWVAHGLLLGWFWDGLHFPWDLDIDVQMPVADLAQLGLRFNNLLVALPQELFSTYYVDVGLLIRLRVHGNGNNNIDARFIDTNTGFFIDITGLLVTGEVQTELKHKYRVYLLEQYGKVNDGDYTRYVEDEREKVLQTKQNTKPGRVRLVLAEQRAALDSVFLEMNRKMDVVFDRNNHAMALSDLVPLRLTLVEGTYGYVPTNPEVPLDNEYKTGRLNPWFKGHFFSHQLRTWVDSEDRVDVFGDKDDQGHTWEEWQEFMVARPHLLEQVVRTMDTTRSHEKVLVEVPTAVHPPLWPSSHEYLLRWNEKRWDEVVGVFAK